jgi:hypothetical protein
MAHQTSAIRQQQTTPRSIGRLMDADFSAPVFLVVSTSAALGILGGTETCVTAVKGSLAPVTVRKHTARMAP